MMEVTGNNATEAKQSAGQQLQAARLARGQSIEDVARQLRLSVRQIAALEEEDYSKLPSGTFLRGFVRNYAKLMKLDAEPLLQSIQQSLPPASPQTMQQPMEIPFPSERGTGKRNLFVIGLISVLGLSLLVYETYRSNGQGQTALQIAAGTETGMEQAAQPVQPQPALPPADTDTAASADVETAPPAEPAAADPPKNDDPPPAAVASAAVPQPPDRAKAILRFVFIEKSWVQVKDGEGRTIFSQINPEGSEQVVSGKPPFSLVIGNATGVMLTYNDQPVDLAPHIRQQVANLKLE